METGSSSDRTAESADPNDAIGLLLRIAAGALDVQLVALLLPDGAALRVVRMHDAGCALGPDTLHFVAQALRAAARNAATGPGGVVPIVGSPSGSGAAVPLGCARLNGPGVLLALGPDKTELDSSWHGQLVDLAHLAALQLEAASAAEESERAISTIGEALLAMPEAVAIFDHEHRFVFWNQHFEAIYMSSATPITRGLPFEEHVRNSLDAGKIVSARGREKEWLADRMARFDAAEGAHEHQLENGRWIRVQDRALPSGGRVGIRFDVTELVRREQSFRLLFEANPVPMLLIGRETLAILSANDAAVAFYGFALPEFLTLTVAAILADDAPGEARASIQALVGQDGDDLPSVHRTASGERKVVRLNIRSIDHEGQPAILAAVLDVTEQQRMEAEVRRTHAFLTDVVDQVPLAVFVKDMWDSGRYVLYNRAGEEMVGRSRDAIIGRTTREVFPPDEAERFSAQDVRTLQRDRAETLDEDTMRRQDGKLLFVRTRKISVKDRAAEQPRYVLGVMEDLTERRANDQRIAHMAHHDPLTDLPNRFLLTDRLEAALARLPGASEQLALLYIDLDGFKTVNDTLGHAAGDRLLQAVGERLRVALRPSDTVARIGGDEFVVLQAPLSQPGEAALFAGRLLATLARPFAIDDRTAVVGASIGISLAPLNGLDATVLLAAADAALFRAKREGRNTFRFAESADVALPPPPPRLEAHLAGP